MLSWAFLLLGLSFQCLAWNVTFSSKNASISSPDLEVNTSSVDDKNAWEYAAETCYTDMMRTDDLSGQIMSNHAICMGKGVQRFCCPEKSKWTGCAWRGLRSKGACQPGCNNGETEVGTLSEGCPQGGHQSACCVGQTGGLYPYTHCKWFSDNGRWCAGSGKQARCGENYSHFVFASSRGFGGEERCKRGARSFCCKREVPTFTDCKWQFHATSLHNGMLCEPSCPPGQVKLGTQENLKGCEAGGIGAFCCAGRPKPDWYKAVDQFKSDVQFYAKNRGTDKCPLASLPVDDEEGREDQPDSNTDIIEPPIKHDLRPPFSKRADPECLRTWNSLSKVIHVVLAKDEQYYTDEERRKKALFEDYYAESFYPGFTFEDLKLYVSLNPYTNLQAIIDQVLFDPVLHTEFFHHWRDIYQHICQRFDQLSPVVPTKVNVSINEAGISNVTLQNYTNHLEPRRMFKDIDDGLRDMNFAPNFGLIVSYVLANMLSLYFARWLPFEAYESDREPGYILELVYWIGPIPGVWDEQLDNRLGLASVRDHQVSEGRWGHLRNRFVVFHLHFGENNRGRFRDLRGHTYDAINMFHAARAYHDRNGIWTIAGREREPNGYNVRAVMDCPRGPGRETPFGQRRGMWAGPHRLELNNDNLNRINDWLTDLYNMGYLNAIGFGNILHNPQHRPNSGYQELLPDVTYIMRRPELQPPPPNPIHISPYENTHRIELLDVGWRFVYQDEIPMPVSIDLRLPRGTPPAMYRLLPATTLPPPPPTHAPQQLPPPPPPPPPPPTHSELVAAIHA
ncbi:hypothetical protein DM02DRAFT_680827 [Periconia macrospinosa]|uniref:Uncharacterized protein n=1 Tax=Periconia macrospinosa TaxID=97972 RepID=A0A2V1DLR9_9PLEO|nr:hypothetical protein DM02DRAFT_680827 [Periconia macrospinosa]